MIRRRYVDGRHGQVHLRESGWHAGGVPLVCLHATAYSSRSFERLMAAFGAGRHVIAVDTPGYGESDRPGERPGMAGYADLIAEAIAGIPGPIDLFGYHTGCAIAAELAIGHAAGVRRLVMLGVPHFRALDFEAWRVRLATPHRLGDGLDQFAERWDFLVARRPAGLSLERAFANFVDELKAWPQGSWAHEALFDWDAEARLPLVRQPVLVLNPAGHLAEPSRVAARLLGAAVVEMQDLSGAVLEAAAAEIAAAAGRFLSGRAALAAE